jgi:ATP-binding cassette subfamily B (MDR/TAP) protein 1
MEAMAKAQGAAWKMYQLIEKIPLINSFSEDGEKPDKVEGYIKFEDIKFNYPTRPGIVPEI